MHDKKLTVPDTGHPYSPHGASHIAGIHASSQRSPQLEAKDLSAVFAPFFYAARARCVVQVGACFRPRCAVSGA